MARKNEGRQSAATPRWNKLAGVIQAVAAVVRVIIEVISYFM